MSGAIVGADVAVLRVAPDGDDAVVAELAARGARPRVVAVGTIEDRPDAEVLAACGDVRGVRWVAVTSAHAARRLATLATSWPPTLRVAAVGEPSAAAVRGTGRRCDLVAPDGTAASLAAALDGGPVLFLAAGTARDDLAEGLAARGIELRRVTAYDVVPRALREEDARVLAACAALVALSPRALDALVELHPRSASTALGPAPWSDRPLVVIGPTTLRHATSLGLAVAACARDRGPVAVADAVASALDGRSSVAR